MLPAEAVVSTISRVERSASHDETRPILTGILMSVTGTDLKMVATDSYRLSVKETTLETPVEPGFEANVPAPALAELSRLAADASEISITVRENQVVFEIGERVLSSRLIDGQFPNYNQLLPDSYEHELRVDAQEIADVVRRISLMAQKNAPLRLRFAEGELTVSAQTPDVGEAEETVPIPFAGEPFEIGFNPGVPARRPRERGERRDRSEADQPTAPGPDRVGRRWGIPLPDHAHPPQRVRSR